MREFEIVVEGKVREIYEVEAASAEEAREMWDSGEVLTATVTEVYDTEVVEVEDITEED